MKDLLSKMLRGNQRILFNIYYFTIIMGYGLRIIYQNNQQHNNNKNNNHNSNNSKLQTLNLIVARII